MFGKKNTYLGPSNTMLEEVYQEAPAWPACTTRPLTWAMTLALGSGASSTTQLFTAIMPNPVIGTVEFDSIITWFWFSPVATWRRYQVSFILASQWVGHEKDGLTMARMKLEMSSRDKAFWGVLSMALGKKLEGQRVYTQVLTLLCFPIFLWVMVWEICEGKGSIYRHLDDPVSARNSNICLTIVEGVRHFLLGYDVLLDRRPFEERRYPNFLFHAMHYPIYKLSRTYHFVTYRFLSLPRMNMQGNATFISISWDQNNKTPNFVITFHIWHLMEACCQLATYSTFCTCT